MKQVHEGLALAKVCASSESASALFQPSHKGFVKAGPNMAHTHKKTQITFRWFLGFPHNYAPRNDKSNKTMSSCSPRPIVLAH